MVPNGWTNQKLPEFAWFQEGPGLRKWQFTDSGCKVINITNIVNGYLDLTKTERHISQEELNEKYKHFLCDAGDIVIASSGNSYCKHGIVRKQDLPLVMNTSVIRFKPRENCDYEFLNQFLKSKYLKQQIDILITGGAQPNFGPAHLKQVELNLPPLPEQRKIAQILSTWDKAIATTEKLIDASKQQKKALVQQLLTGKKRFKDQSGNEFPKWINEPIGKYLASYKELVPANTEIPVLTSSRTGLYIQERSVINEGDYGVLPLGYFTYRHMSDDLIFKFNVNRTWKRGAVSKEYPVFKTVGLDSRFLESQLNEGNDFKRFAVQQKQGGTRTRLYFKNLKELKLNLPCLEEQQKIASVLTAADKEIELLETKLAHLKQEKKALMQQLLTGKRRVKVEHMEEATC